MSYNVYPVDGSVKNAFSDRETYLQWNVKSIKKPDMFWSKHGRRIDWFKPINKVKNRKLSFKMVVF